MISGKLYLFWSSFFGVGELKQPLSTGFTSERLVRYCDKCHVLSCVFTLFANEFFRKFVIETNEINPSGFTSKNLTETNKPIVK
ncbi:hypothetical protein GCM10023092_18460 [Rurimicrobium arvi]|uniref:Uncharacterized protein n=1 Tax=Rurimicrobium arvi TaxID=2049916 RepID=A0ABP8MS55_9BACT